MVDAKKLTNLKVLYINNYLLKILDYDDDEAKKNFSVS